jgi:hypothetical protein
MKIQGTAPDGTTTDIIVNDAPNQRDAKLIARRMVTGGMEPPEGTTAVIVDLYART